MRINLNYLNKFFILLILGVFVSLLLAISVYAAPPDNDNNGCVSLGEISSYVASWLNGGGVTLSQVSSGVSWWLGGCTVSDRSLLFSQAKTLTWPPVVVNDGLYGAESNPTGNPIGGFYGYNRIVSPSDADFIVHNKDEFLSALQQVQPGQIIYVDDNSIIDLTGVWSVDGVSMIDIIVPNITIASGRGRGFSKGGIIRNLEQVNAINSPSHSLIDVNAFNVRITGLRIEGPDKSTQATRHNAIFYENGDTGRPDLVDTYYQMVPSTGILSWNGRFLEVDNCEIYGWSYAGINLYRNGWSSENTWIHHNYFHNNVHAGLGYGVMLGYSYAGHDVTSLIEGNILGRNRHSITGAYTRYSSYEARYNIILEDGTSHQIDRHYGRDASGNGGAGDYTFIHHNSDRYYGPSRDAVGISGPPYVTNGGQVYNNWAYSSVTYDESPFINILLYNNFEGFIPPAGTSFPVAVLTLEKDVVSIGSSITFSASGSTAGSAPLSYACFDYGDSTPEDCGLMNAVKSHSYSQPGRYLITLRVVDVKGVFTTTTKSVIVNSNNPDAVILSFWVKDSYNEYSTNDLSGFFKKKVLIDNIVVWERDVNSDGNEWEHVIVDITPYVKNVSEFNFQIETLQNFNAQPYPADHPFDFFEVYLDDIYISNREYSVENFGDWEADQYGRSSAVGIDDVVRPGYGAMHYYETGDSWWTGSASYDSVHSGKFSFMIDSGYRLSSTAGSTRGVKQTILAPKSKVLLDVVNNFGTLRDVSSYQLPVSFAGNKDLNNNDVLDFYGYSKKLNGVDNFVAVANLDLSADWVLSANLFLPYQNTPSTLMYASNGVNYVHIYYSPTNKIVFQTNAGENSCDIPQLSHSSFNKIVVGRSCVGATCTLSCASNGIVNSFSNPSAAMTLTGTSTVSFGGHNSGSTNMFGAINRIKLVRGPLSSVNFIDESKSKIQGAWYFRDGTGSIIEDGSAYNKDITIPAGLNFGSEGEKRFVRFVKGGPGITIPRDSSMNVGKEFSVELIARFDDLTSDAFLIVDGMPFIIANRKYFSQYYDGRRIHFALKVPNAPAPGYFGDSQWGDRYAVTSLHELKDDVWHHLVFTKYDDYLRMYIDGNLERKTYIPGLTYSTLVEDLTINKVPARNIALDSPFNGDIQRFTLWDKTLSDSDVEALYKSSSLGCSDVDNDGYGVFPRSGVVNGCRLNGFDCNDANTGIGGGGC